jgi:hypothetical protein
MHSMDIMFEDTLPRKGHEGPEAFDVLHNGDFSGDISITIEDWRVEQYCAADSDYARHGYGLITVELPFEILGEIVAEAIRRRMIGEAEDATWQSILDL